MLINERSKVLDTFGKGNPEDLVKVISRLEPDDRTKLVMAENNGVLSCFAKGAPEYGNFDFLPKVLSLLKPQNLKTVLTNHENESLKLLVSKNAEDLADAFSWLKPDDRKKVILNNSNQVLDILVKGDPQDLANLCCHLKPDDLNKAHG
jgi:hypothetical protein